MPQFTLTLDQATADRIGDLLATFAGSIPGFAGSLAADVSKLPPDEIRRLRREIAERVKDYEVAKQIHEKQKA